MKRVLLAASLLVLVLGQNSWAGDDKDWVPLFNGKDTEGWKVHPDEPGDWSVKDGVLIGKGGQPQLYFTPTAATSRTSTIASKRRSATRATAANISAPSSPTRPAIRKATRPRSTAPTPIRKKPAACTACPR